MYIIQTNYVLNTNYDYEIQNPENRKAVEYDQMNDDIRERLLELYKPHNEKFFQIINHRFNWDN